MPCDSDFSHRQKLVSGRTGCRNVAYTNLLTSWDFITCCDLVGFLWCSIEVSNCYFLPWVRTVSAVQTVQ